jgi:hypothetical protein
MKEGALVSSRISSAYLIVAAASASFCNTATSSIGEDESVLVAFELVLVAFEAAKLIGEPFSPPMKMSIWTIEPSKVSSMYCGAIPV